jgi:hypothetical protein
MLDPIGVPQIHAPPPTGPRVNYHGLSMGFNTTVSHQLCISWVFHGASTAKRTELRAFLASNSVDKSVAKFILPVIETGVTGGDQRCLAV